MSYWNYLAITARLSYSFVTTMRSYRFRVALYLVYDALLSARFFGLSMSLGGLTARWDKSYSYTGSSLA